jgi:lipopolysaccharide/colanic/teichoic acid biosynthesis glycosyltransferase
LVLTAPLFAYIAIRIRRDSDGPVFFRQERLGLDMRPFTCLKFRTMRADTDPEEHRQYVESVSSSGAAMNGNGMYKLDRDDVVTPFGRWLRKTSLDELPTLWNVLKGDMSIVGPRPENPQSAALYTAAQQRVWTVRPGITSLATLKYRHEERLLAGVPNVEAAYVHLMQDKLTLELEYVERQSFGLDLRIMVQTLWAVLR